MNKWNNPEFGGQLLTSKYGQNEKGHMVMSVFYSPI
jgi:hypothetical protein